MAKIAARKGSLYLDDQTGACTGISALVKSINLKFTAEATDLTGFGNDNRERASDGLKDIELSCDGFYGAGASETNTLLAAIRAAGGSTRFRFGPAGSTNGCPSYSACVVLTTYDIKSVSNDSLAISFTLAGRSGSLTRTTVW